MAELEKEVVSEEKQEKKQVAKKTKTKAPREHKLGRKVKETTSELKKVSWLSFGEVVKRTGIVLGFVLLSAIVLFGVEYLFGLLHQLIVTSIGG